MATIQLGNTKVANKLISYAEKRAEVQEGIDCPSEYAKAQFKATRELWGKNDGIQAHHVIQSFKPGEVTPELANQIGQDLARDIAKGYECVVYTHTDKDHIHNHIVINSVSYEDGRKFHAHGKDAIDQVREASDKLCKEHGLSVVKEPFAEKRYDRAEYGLAKRGIVSWKDELRDVIDHEKKHSKSYENFKENLKEKYNIEIKERGKNISFKHPDSKKFVRGKTLGIAYERGTLENGFTRQAERGTSQERGKSEVSSQQSERGSEREQSRASHEIESSRRVSINASERGHAEGNSDRNRAETNSRSQSEITKGNNFNYDDFHKRLEERKRGLQAGYKQQYYKANENDRISQSSASKQQRADSKGLAREQGNHSEQIDRNREEQQKQHERVAEQDHDYDYER